MKIFLAIVTHDIKLSFKKGSEAFNLLAFYLISASLFVFAIGADVTFLQKIGSGIIWVCALLASMLGVSRVFDEDYKDGSLAQIFLQGSLPEVIISAKILAHWLVTGLPIVILSPLVGLMLGISDIDLLLFSLVVGTPVLSMITCVGAALTLGLSRGGGLVGLLILPLYIPVLIFGVGVFSENAALPNLMLLFGLGLFMLPVSVIAASFAIKFALEDG